MRVVQAVGWYLPDSVGGTEVYVSALARQLVRRGCAVLVAAPDPTRAGTRQYLHDDIPVFRYPIPPRPTREEARGITRVRGAELFHRWLRDTRPDVVHFHTFVTGLGLAEVEAARATGARVIVTTHSASLGFLCERGTMFRDGQQLCDGEVPPRACAVCVLQQRGLPALVAGTLAHLGPAVPSVVPRPARIGTALDLERLIAERRAAQHRLLATVDHFVVLSEWARAVLLRNGAPAARVVVNRLAAGPRPGGWPRKPGPDEAPTVTPVTVGYVGRAEPVKGLDDLVFAMQAVPGDVPIIVRVVAIASGPGERRELARLARAARREPRIVFEPAVAPNDVPGLLASIDVLCCPSRVVEGGPTVALEAQAVGTPVIGADLPALSEIVRPIGGALVPPGDRAALARLLADLGRRPAQVDAWRRHQPEPRPFDAVVDEYLALYQA